MAKRRGLLGPLTGLLREKPEDRRVLAGLKRADAQRKRAQAKAEAARKQAIAIFEKKAKAQRTAAERKAKALLKKLDREEDRKTREDKRRMTARERVEWYGTSKTTRRPPRRHNPESQADRKAYAAAKRLSEEFHGTATEVVELSESERAPLPRYAVLVGEVEEMAYSPDKPSKRSANTWEHKSGDQGFLSPKSNKKPLLVVNPFNRRPSLVMDKSPMVLTRDGLKG